MIGGQRVLGLVPARSGSKGIPDKNMALLGGQSLIARTGQVLSRISWLDRRVISTDSPLYADEGRRFGLDAPFLRPDELSTDSAAGWEVIIHALETCEEQDECTYDLVVFAEPTSPLRTPSDIESTMKTLLESNADTAFTVSRIDSKCHPHRIFDIKEGLLEFYSSAGSSVTARQQVAPLYARNGLCYCVRREALITKRTIYSERMVPVITERPVVNVDEPLDLLWAEFLLEREQALVEAI